MTTGNSAQYLETPSRVVIKPRWYENRKLADYVRKAIVLLILTVGAIFVMIPTLWMISTSLKTEADIAAYPPVWIPSTLRWQNYVDVTVFLPLGQMLINTLVLTFGRLAGHLTAASICAFAFSRLRAPDRDVLFLLVLATMMLPSEVTLIPTFVLFTKLGWVNSLRPLIIPHFFGGGAFNIFLLRQYMLTIPLEYDDAARIDGCGYLRLFFHIILPLSAPALATVAIFSIMGSWNDFFGPLIYLRDVFRSTLALGLFFFRGVYTPMWSHLMAMSTMVMLPIVVMFFFAQRLFIQGVVISGVKG